MDLRIKNWHFGEEEEDWYFFEARNANGDIVWYKVCNIGGLCAGKRVTYLVYDNQSRLRVVYEIDNTSRIQEDRSYTLEVCFLHSFVNDSILISELAIDLNSDFRPTFRQKEYIEFIDSDKVMKTVDSVKEKGVWLKMGCWGRGTNSYRMKFGEVNEDLNNEGSHTTSDNGLMYSDWSRVIPINDFFMSRLIDYDKFIRVVKEFFFTDIMDYIKGLEMEEL